MKTTRQAAVFAGLASLALAAGAAACGDSSDGGQLRARGGGGGDGPNSGDDGGVGAGDDGGVPPGTSPFEPVGPASYVPKIKNVMTGLAATDAEVQAVLTDPTALRGLVDQWMALPEFESRMLDFFRNAFQQNQADIATVNAFKINDQDKVANYRGRLNRNLMDSFPMTAWEIVKSGQPFNGAVTTDHYMMTTALMSAMSYVDDDAVDDKAKRKPLFTANPTWPTKDIVIDQSAATAAIPLADTLDPTNANYMVWHYPGTAVAPSVAGCTTTSMALTPTISRGPAYWLMGFLWGRMPFDPCTPSNGNDTRFQPQFADADFTDWRMVTVHAAPDTALYASPSFYEIPKLRAATDLTLATRRLGFFGTLAFDANWVSNTTNELRVTANQALIVGIGQSIDGEGVLTPFPVNAVDADHASNPACAGCHAQLDPYKQFFRQSYTFSYSHQTDPAQISAAAGFGIDGVNASGSGVGDVAATLASHPRFPLAWVLKLGSWANSTPLDEADPEVLRIADAFRSSNFDFKTLARELFSSPLVTYASATKTTQTNGVVNSIARRDQLCATLSNRLGLADVCGSHTVVPSSTQSTINARSLMMPVDVYYRGYALASLTTSADLFYRNSAELVCKLVGDQLVDVKTGTSRYVGTDPTTAIADFVATVMALPPSDPRAAPALTILTDNFSAAKAAGATASDALKSTFTLACLAPSNVIIGL